MLAPQYTDYAWNRKKHITGACDIIEERYDNLFTTQRKRAGHKACYDGSPAQCCQLVYKYTKFEKLCIFSKYLVYHFLIWYIGKIWYIFGIFLSEGLIEILNQFIWFTTKRKQRNGVEAI